MASTRCPAVQHCTTPQPTPERVDVPTSAIHARRMGVHRLPGAYPTVPTAHTRSGGGLPMPRLAHRLVAATHAHPEEPLTAVDDRLWDPPPAHTSGSTRSHPTLLGYPLSGRRPRIPKMGRRSQRSPFRRPCAPPAAAASNSLASRLEPPPTHARDRQPLRPVVVLAVAAAHPRPRSALGVGIWPPPMRTRGRHPSRD